MTRSLARRRGFTLIELLMAIVIIGMLAALTSFAVRRALIIAKQRANQVEIDQLGQAMNMYKERTREYPPCFSESIVEGSANDGLVMKQRFLDHMRYAFPRMRLEGNTTVDQYAWLRERILDSDNGGYAVRVGTSAPFELDLDNLVLNGNSNSAAEALVFWLGGMPMPIDKLSGAGGNELMGSRKLFGFHKDVFSPFRIVESVPQGSSTTRTREIILEARTKPLFEFDESRLCDLDGDGWLEYLPKHEDGTIIGRNAHPIVYFDHRTYNRAGAGSNGNATDAPAFRPYVHPVIGDYAVPYARQVIPGQTLNFTNGTNIRWMADSSFQIITAGLDSDYGGSERDPKRKVFALLPNQQSADSFVGGGFLKDVGQAQPAPFDLGENDNQTNFDAALVGDIQLK